MANISNTVADAHTPTQAQGAPNGHGDLGRLTQGERYTIYEMILVAEDPLEVTVEMDIYDEKYITVAQPALLRASREIFIEATGLSYHHNKFFVIVDGPSNTGKNLQDLQHGVDALLRLLISRGARHLELTLQANLMHGDLWHKLDSASLMKLADLAARRMVQITINNNATRFKLPHGLNIQFTPWYTLPDHGSQGLNVTQEMANLRLRQAQLGTNLYVELREAQLGWFRTTLRSLGTHRINLRMEIVNLTRAQGEFPQICFIGVGEDFGCYIRTTDHHSDEFLPVASRLQLAQGELECTRIQIALVNTEYQLMCPLNR